MDNRERDRVSQRNTPTDAGELNRGFEEEKGRRQHSDTTAEFGQNIGESEFPNDSKGGNMNNRNRDDVSKSNIERESTRRSGLGDMGSSSGRSSGSSNEIGSDRSSSNSSSSRRGSSGELGSTGSSDRSDRNEGRH
jgi:hypothetical protein